jgi:type II secretory pathway predicted ATPase ExeA
MDYVKFFGLEREAFQNDLDQRFYFEGGSQRRARMQLGRAIGQRKGLALVLGAPGLGKTTLAHRLLADLDPAKVEAHLLVSSHRECARGWFLPQFARLYGASNPSTRIPELIDQIHELLLGVRLAGRHPVLLIDEAQLLGEPQTLEEFRALLNLSHAGQRVFSLVLFGMQELGGVLALDPALAQRVDVRVQLSPFTAAETGAYLAHRLTCAGGAPALLAASAVDALYRYSGGVLRLLNTLADNAFFEAALDESRQVGADHVAAAAQQLELSPSALEGEVGEAAAAFHAQGPADGRAHAPAPAEVPGDEPENELLLGEPASQGGEEDDWLEPVGPVLDEVLKTFDDATLTQTLGDTVVPGLSGRGAPLPASEDAAEDPLGWTLVEPKAALLEAEAPDAPRAEELAALPGAGNDDDSMANLSFADDVELPQAEPELEDLSDELDELVLGEEPEAELPAARPSKGKGPRIDLPEDEDLDLLFDDIQIES